MAVREVYIMEKLFIYYVTGTKVRIENASLENDVYFPDFDAQIKKNDTCAFVDNYVEIGDFFLRAL